METPSPQRTTGLLGAGQDRGRPLDRHGVRAGAPGTVAGRGYGRIDLLVQQVLGQGDEDGTGRGLGGHLEGAREHEQDVLRAAQLGAPLGVLAGGLHEVAPQQRLLGDEARVLLARRDDQGCAAASGVVEHAHSVAQAGGDVQVNQRGLLGGAGVAFGHADGHSLLEGQDVLDLRVVLEGLHEGQLRCAGVPEDVLNTVCHELVHEGVFREHADHALSSVAR